MRIDEALRSHGEGLAPQIHRGGLSSREGLAALIHDGYRLGPDQISPVDDKRLWVVESEFANVLQQSRRGGNTLSAALRDCWDGVDLKPATKTNRVHATAPHVCLSGGISPAELLSLVRYGDLFNGLINRFLLIWGERPEIQPFPRRTDQARVDELAAKVGELLIYVRSGPALQGVQRPLVLTEAARRRYSELYRNELNQNVGCGLVDNLLERRAPMVLRVAMLLALTDRQWCIDDRHIQAGMAWVRYATDSVMYVFSSKAGMHDNARVTWAAERINEFLATRGSASRRDLLLECFRGHQPAAVVDAALAKLIDMAPARIRVEVRPRSHGGPGRPATIYRYDQMGASVPPSCS
jgi:putative DNA primase/helicase